MVKKAKGERRGFQRGPARHKIGANSSNEREDSLVLKVLHSLGSNAVSISGAARVIWLYIARLCTLFCLTPLELAPGSGRGSVQFGHQSSLWKRIIHYFLAVTYTSIMVYKVAVLVHLLFYGESTVMLVMCFGVSILLFLAIAAASGTTWTTWETLDMVSGCESLRQNMLTSTGKHIDQMSQVPYCLKWISVAGIAHISALVAAAFSLVFEDLPASVLRTFKVLGMLPQTSLPTFIWQIAFFPLEVLVLVPPMIVTSFNFYIFLMGMGMLNSYADELRYANLAECSMVLILIQKERECPNAQLFYDRSIDLTDRDGWCRVEHLYRCMRLYNNMYSNWMRYLLAPVIFFWGAAVTITLYVTFRPLGLPLLMHGCFPVLAFVSILIVTWLFYDGVVAKRAADEVLANLQSKTAGYYQRLEPASKKELARRGRALQPVYLGIGQFSEITLEVAMNIWDEVINQLLFCLSL